MLSREDIASALRSERARQRLSRADAALEAGVSPSTYGRWERGESCPDVISWERLTRAWPGLTMAVAAATRLRQAEGAGQLRLPEGGET